MQLFDIGQAPGVMSMAIFHAAAELDIECIIITTPGQRFLCTGYFDNASQILDMEIVQEQGLPIFRRRIGGGTVLLDTDQIFYQMVLKRNNPLIPKVVAQAYKLFSKPPLTALGSLGVEAAYRPINDLVVLQSEKKISGQGAGVTGECFVFVGNLLLDFDFSAMANMFNVSNEIRSALEAGLRDNLTTLRLELGLPPSMEWVKAALINAFLNEYNGLSLVTVPGNIIDRAEELCKSMTAPEFVHEEQNRKHDEIKLREGVYFPRSKSIHQ